MNNQTTIARAVSCEGVGLHNGVPARLTVRPAPADAGLVFRRTDLPQEAGRIRVRPDAVADTRLCTLLANKSGASVATVEHLLAGLVGMGVDNAIIEIDAPEIPAMDGSAEPFARMVAEAGVRALAAAPRAIRVLRPVELVMGDKRARFEPFDGFEIDVSIDFDNSAIGRQRAVFAPAAETFLDEVAPARTFGFLHEVEAMKAAGFARGGSLDNAVVIDGETVMNEDGLRYADEFVRHKALDALGDLAMAGARIIGRYIAVRPGHALNNAALLALLSDEDAWRWEGRQTAAERAANDAEGAVAANA